jgi:hypothetical protein
MREMVFRERQERVAHVDAIAKMIARVFGVDANTTFGPIVAEYATEVFQETYDADLLRRKVAHRRATQAAIRDRRLRDENALRVLDKMGEYVDRKIAAEKASKKPKQNK